MSTIANDIEEIIIHQLKLHWTTTEDLTEHVAEKIIPKYPDSEITIPGILARLESLQEELQVEQTQINNRQVWKLYGENITVPNRVWNIITSLTKLECHIQSIIYTIRKQDESIISSEIKNSIGILESNKIIQIRNNVAGVTPAERQLILLENSS